MPNPQATIDATSQWYLQQGVLGATCLFLLGLLIVAGLVIRRLYKDLLAKDALLLAMAEKVGAITQSAIAASHESALAMASLEAALEARGRVIEELSRQIERMGTDVRHGYKDVVNALNALPEILRLRFESLLEVIRGGGGR